MAREKMHCAECGMEMNHHAEKVDFSASLFYPDAVDPDFEGIVQEAHSCPGCGKTILRVAE